MNTKWNFLVIFALLAVLVGGTASPAQAQEVQHRLKTLAQVLERRHHLEAIEASLHADPVGEVVQMEHGGRDSTGGLRLAKSIAAPDPVRIVAIAVGARARI